MGTQIISCQFICDMKLMKDTLEYTTEKMSVSCFQKIVRIISYFSVKFQDDSHIPGVLGSVVVWVVFCEWVHIF